MKTKTTRTQHFEVRSISDNYGLAGRFDSEGLALEAINISYMQAKAKGYDNRNMEWVIVCSQNDITFNDNGEFMKEETVRFVTESVEFSDEQNRFVFVY